MEDIYKSYLETCPSDQLPTTTTTTMAAAGGNGRLVPHMRLFVPRRCIELIEDDPPSKRMHFLLGSGGGYPSRHGDGKGDGDSNGNGGGNGDGDGDNNNNQTTIT